MPWTAKQHRLFEAAAHNPSIARAHGMSQGKAASMAREGVKGRGRHLARALRRAKGGSDGGIGGVGAGGGVGSA